MSKQVVVYPAGFVGYDVGWPIVRNEPEFDAQVALARFGQVTAKDKLVISNNHVEELFQQWRTRAFKTTNAKFVGNICAAVANAFGTTSFYEWCHMQTLSPYFTAYHRQFLNETLRFIQGESRTYGYPTWVKLLRVERATGQDALEHFEYQDIMLNWGMDRTSVQDVINRWISQPKGIDDMIATAHLIFGDVV